MDREKLKWIAVAAMMMDHVAYLFLPEGTAIWQAVRFFGRITGPVMAYFIAEGCHYTRDIRKYAARLAIFALVSWVPYAWFTMGESGFLLMDGAFVHGSILFTFFLGVLGIMVWQEDVSWWVKWGTVTGLCFLSMGSDYGIAGVLWPLWFYLYRNSGWKKWVLYAIPVVCFIVPMAVVDDGVSGCLYLLGYAVPPLLVGRLYDGRQGSGGPLSKWAFYVIYPLHMLVLVFLAYAV